MMQLKKSLQSWRKWLFFKKKAILFSLLAIIFGFVFYRLFSLKEFSCYCDDLPCDANTCQVFQTTLSRNYLTLNKKAVNYLVGEGKTYERMDFKYNFPHKLNIHLTQTSNYLVFNTAISQAPLSLSINDAPISSESSAPFEKPTIEIQNIVTNINTISLKIYPGGENEVIATESSKIFNINTSKKDQDWYKKAYELIKLVTLYTEVVGIYILDNDLYFARLNSSDLIISLDQDQEKTLKALQLLGFLNTIKKDQKIIDLRYTNPIIR